MALAPKLVLLAISGLQECYIKIEQYYINVQKRYEDKVAVKAVNILYFYYFGHVWTVLKHNPVLK